MSFTALGTTLRRGAVVEAGLHVGAFVEVAAVVQPPERRIGHRLVEQGEVRARLHGLDLDVERPRLTLQGLGEGLQRVLGRHVRADARRGEQAAHRRGEGHLARTASSIHLRTNFWTSDSIWTGPTSVSTIFVRSPLRESPPSRPAGSCFS
jgi:hypothetical protein